MKNLCCIFIFIGSTLLSQQNHAAIATFDDLSLAANTAFDPQAVSQFVSGGLTFDHVWEFGCCWGGFSYSNKTDTTTAGFGNDRSAITGDGAGTGQDNYAVFTNAFSVATTLQFNQSTLVNSADFTNTTYAYLAMANGDDGNTPAFVKGPFQDADPLNGIAADYFRLTINGLDGLGNTISSTILSLAEGSNILDTWSSVDLSVLGTVSGLSFAFDSSDQSGGFINTPTYFAIDNINYQAVPLPGAGYLFLSGVAGLLLRNAGSIRSARC
ncbi:MAG: DUF4465 domain-containing protein [Pseudomonadales bacterium]